MPSVPLAAPPGANPFDSPGKLVPRTGWAHLEQLGHRSADGFYLDDGQSRILFCRPKVDCLWNGVRVRVGHGAVVVGAASLHTLTPSAPPADPEAFVLETLAESLWKAVRAASTPGPLQVGDRVRFESSDGPEASGEVLRLEDLKDFDDEVFTRAVVRLDAPRKDFFGGSTQEDDCDGVWKVREVVRGGVRVWPPEGLVVELDPPVLGPR